MQRIEDRTFRPSFFVKVPPAELPDLQRRLGILDQVAATRVVMKRTGLAAEAPEPLLEVEPRHYADLRDATRIVDSAGKYYEYELFDVDLRLSQRYFLEHGIFPMGLVTYDGAWRALEEHFALEYEIPDLRREVLDVRVDAPAGIPRMDDRLLAASLGDDVVDGDEEDVVRGINALIEDRDPDIVFTDGGDAFVMPYLEKKARENGVDLRLGRDPGFHGARSAKSYFTYGKIVYKPSQYLLKGRLHLDRGHFAVRESGFAGLVELSRLSTLPPQEQARLTPGTAITAMQTNLARKDGVAIMWKKNMPEEFKTAEDLVLGDRGGFIFEPEVGLHEGVVEIDYASLYPRIMVKFNISQETLDCPCCTLNGRAVPALKYHLCTRRIGLIPRVLQPLVERKRYYKRTKKENTPLREIYEGRDTILKWTLVTCFGYMGYRNARFGRIECHEAINAYARDLLLRSMEIAEEHGYEVVHGIVDSLWLRPTAKAGDVRKLIEHIHAELGLPIDLEGTYRWLVFLPCKTTGVGALNRYYGMFETGEFKLRGIELRKHDTPTVVNKMEELILKELARAKTADEFRAAIPRCVDLIRGTAKALRENRVPLADLVITKTVTKKVGEYVVLTATVAALRQLEKRGFAVEPGEYVRYVLLDEAAKEAEAKVRPAQFLTGHERPDAQAYVRLICRAGETLFAPF
ncbi:MAG TPA: DNA polymerase domain-containing protein, partial [Thermoplasmata archaeon]|nr:DNA polymerase domain-containing protein [Thermoplasmata archaeon]